MRIGIVDDHQIIRDGLKILLSENQFMITIEAINGVDMINKLKSLTRSEFPEVFIVDISMPIMDGFETVSWLKSKYPNIKVIAFSMRDDDDSVLRMIKLGVKSYLTKDCSTSVLVQAIRTVYDDKFYFPENITSIIVKGHQQDDKLDNSTPKLSDLTEREIQFLKLVCTEMPYQEIAKEMQISLRTVDGFRESLFKKLKVGSRVGLAFMAIRIKLISI